MKKYFITTLALLLTLSLTACGINTQKLTKHLTENVSDLSYLTDNPIQVSISDGVEGENNAYRIDINLNYAAGDNLAIAAKELTPLIYQLAETKQVEISTIESEEDDPDTSNSISWLTWDGIDGFYSNDTVEPKVSKPSVLLEELTSPDITVDIAIDIDTYLRRHITNGDYFSSLSVHILNDKIDVRVRTISSGGLYIPTVAKEIVPLVLDQSEKYDIPIFQIHIEEYTETNEQYGRVPDTTISWSTTDGDIGSYTNEKTNERHSISLDRLSDTLGSLD